ncbi:hypothetical protein [Halopelagius fulvigenes]|uniref:Phosphatidate cytidylyltransferase n=1 Tax=Halopelagius fulvigenes TaxID=1198324 RepID=A0ABD5TZF6_9EURY
MGRRRDALLAVLVSIPLVGAGVLLDAPADPLAATLGAAGALVLEGLLSFDAPRVRRAWDRPAVQIGAVLAAFVAAAVGVARVGPVAVTVVVAGLATYLLVLGGVSLRDALRDA